MASDASWLHEELYTLSVQTSEPEENNQSAGPNDGTLTVSWRKDI